MLKTLIIFLLAVSVPLYSQLKIPEYKIGVQYRYSPTGEKVVRMVNNLKVPASKKNSLNNVNKKPKNINYPIRDSSNSHIRYVVHEKYSIGERCDLSSDGNYSIIAWGLNENRNSLYNISSPKPIWQYWWKVPELDIFSSYPSISGDGTLTVNSYYNQINLINSNNGTCIWSYYISQTLDTLHYAGNFAITKKGDFIIGAVNRWGSYIDTSYLFGFNINSNTPVWKINMPIDTLDNSFVIGIKISGNDSLAIVNSYVKFYVIKIYTGDILYKDRIDPVGYQYSGSGATQGISGDGSVIAVINNYGFIWVYKWDGKKYNLLWEDLEPPDEYYNWIECVDISYDGKYIAAGTWNKYNPNLMQFDDGKVKLYKTNNGNVPMWEYCGDSGGVNSVAFSRNGKILSAVSSGALYEQNSNNLLVFNTSRDTNIIVFALNEIGSFNYTSVSDDGTTVIATGKAVPNSQLGYGGIYYNIFVDTSANSYTIKPYSNGIPNEYWLYQNYPNPFNSTTKINLYIWAVGQRHTSDIQLKIYDLLGKEVFSFKRQLYRGLYELLLDAVNLPSGVYFYQLIADGKLIDTKKMVMIK